MEDYGGAGLRLGCLVSQDEQLLMASRALCRFSSPSQFSTLLAARLLEDRGFVKDFLCQSHIALRDSRLLAERLLDESRIPYIRLG
jgi:1-aminocyclopropane-1-carboxylate synthase